MNSRSVLSQLEKEVLAVMKQMATRKNETEGLRVKIDTLGLMQAMKETHPELRPGKVNSLFSSLRRVGYISKIYDPVDKFVFEINERDPEAVVEIRVKRSYFINL